MPGAAQSNQAATTATELFSENLKLFKNLLTTPQTIMAGASRYTTDFFIPYLLSTHYFQREEQERLLKEPWADSLTAYIGLMQNNLELMERSMSGAADMMTAFAKLEMEGLTETLKQSWLEMNPAQMIRYVNRQITLLDTVTRVYPQAIDAIAPEFGFHFERGEDVLLDETDRFLLYRVTPSDRQVETRMDAKPALIIPPFVLGANILSFLPAEQRSYAHSFANQGIPTYIRILKPIETTPALQIMTGEDDAKDTRRFCEAILNAHGKPVTLNGYCQGGFSGLCNLLSGELDDLVDAFITCVSPMDGTRSQGLAHFLKGLNPRFNDLAYGTKILPNGNRVADGKLMGWVYKLKSIEHEIPAAVFFRDLVMFAHQTNGDFKISKTATALNYWLRYDRHDLPLEITRMSFASYNEPITADGTLPVRLFGKKLNLKRLKEKQIPWLICYGTHDDLVEKETALAPLDYVEAEVTPFPKGHVAIATSWSHPDSACALHTRFGEGNYRGPVRFQIDLDETLTAARSLSAKAPSTKGKRTAGAASSKSAKKTPAAIEKTQAGQGKATQTGSAKPKQPRKTAKVPTAQRAAAKKGTKTTSKTKSTARGTKKKA